MTRLPISGSQFDRLGKRLATGAATPADLATFEEVRIAYGAALEALQGALSSLGLPVTGRVKTTGTLIDKLQRTSGLTIRGVHDLAGMRIIVPAQVIPRGTVVASSVCTREHVIPEGRYAQNMVVDLLERHLNPEASAIITKGQRSSIVERARASGIERSM